MFIKRDRTRKYYLCHKVNYPWIDSYPDDHDLRVTGQIIENAPKTLRKADDGDKFIIKTHGGGPTPYWLHPNDSTPLTHAEVMTELAGAEWQVAEE
jgi:hypothetical protein